MSGPGCLRRCGCSWRRGLFRPGCSVCPWAAARPLAVRAASFARRVASKPGQALPQHLWPTPNQHVSSYNPRPLAPYSVNSHVIPLRLLQTLNLHRWNCNVFPRSRKITVLNYVRNLSGPGLPSPAVIAARPSHNTCGLPPTNTFRPITLTSRCTRSVAIHPIRRGVMPTDRVHRLPQQAQPRALPPDTPEPAASDAATQPRHANPFSEREALHHLGSITPVREHYTS